MRLTRRHLIATLGSLTAITRATRALAGDASSLDRIKASGQLRIGVTSAEPWFFRDPRTDIWTGIGVAMGERLSTNLHVTMVPVETTWANCIPALQAGQIDLMFVLDPTDERKKAIDFPDAPLFYYAMGAWVAENSAVKTWTDIDRPEMKIGVTLGTSLDRTVTDTMKSAEIIRFQNNDLAIAAFVARRIDVVIQFHPALVVQYARLKLGKVILPTPVNPVMTSAGLRRDPNSALKDWVSKQFADLYKAGLPNQLFAAYLRTKNIDRKGIPGLVKEAWL